MELYTNYKKELMEQYDKDDDFKDIVDKMVSYHKSKGKKPFIDIINTTIIFLD